MHDLVIRGATLVDGTGTAARTADLAVDGAKVTAVGDGVGAGRREIAADGLLLAPGWVDIHTHYDGQATWDPYITPSSWHGVTTTVFGNCGVGFAPVRPGSERYLINLMEGVEDIPETVLAEGIDFRWETFNEYLDTLDAGQRVIDIGAQVPHAALRFYAMGDRGADHAARPEPHEIDAMGAMLESALRAGALGLTTSRTIKHRAKDGRYTPGLTAADPELAGLAQAMRRANAGVIEVNSDFGDGDFEHLRAAAEIAGRPLSVLLLQVHNAPDLWRDTRARIHAARAQGMDVTGQVGSRPIGVMMALEGSIHPFTTHPLWTAMEHLTPAARHARLVADTDLRRRLVTERPDDTHVRWIAGMLAKTFRLGSPIDFEPDVSRGIAAVAANEGRDPFAVALDWLMEEGGKAVLFHTFENYYEGNLEVVRELLTDPATVAGIADGGAHVGFICDASSPSSALAFWTRDRTRGEKIPIEYLVKKQTSDTAGVYGLRDRGVLAPGYKADFNLIDMQRLRVLPPEIVYDLPAGGRRMIQKAEGYRHTFVSGVETMRDGEFTGALPGRLVRGARGV